jgi:hypothetical protein
MKQIKQVFQQYFCSVISKLGSLDKFIGWIYITQAILDKNY